MVIYWHYRLRENIALKKKLITIWVNILDIKKTSFSEFANYYKKCYVCNYKPLPKRISIDTNGMWHFGSDQEGEA